MAGKHTIEVTDNEVAILWHAVRAWDDMLGSRFPVVEPWEWDDSNGMNRTAYKRSLKTLVRKVDDA